LAPVLKSHRHLSGVLDFWTGSASSEAPLASPVAMTLIEKGAVP